MSKLGVRDSESRKTVGDSCGLRRRAHAGKVIVAPLAKKGQRRLLELQGSLEPMWTLSPVCHFADKETPRPRNRKEIG